MEIAATCTLSTTTGNKHYFLCTSMSGHYTDKVGTGPWLWALNQARVSASMLEPLTLTGTAGN